MSFVPHTCDNFFHCDVYFDGRKQQPKQRLKLHIEWIVAFPPEIEFKVPDRWGGRAKN